jgi:monofunctional biosynthetic peptidoglycan transglycosylase
MAKSRRGRSWTPSGGRRRGASRPFWKAWPSLLSASARRWLRRAALVLLLVFVAAPLALILLYRFVPPPVTPLMLIRLAQGQGLERDWVPWEEISPHLREAVIASEDNHFCSHWGFDWGSLEAAAKAYAAGERAGGGSTISMQTAKNLFLWPSRSIIRKGLEVPLTASIETLWPKQRILEVYLNVAELGPGIYGVEAASRHYFERPARDLSQTQAARLVAVLPNPLEWRPQPPGNYVQRRAGVIRTRVRQLGPMLDCIRE